MLKVQDGLLPRRLPHAARLKGAGAAVPATLVEAASWSSDEVYGHLGTSPDGLAEEEAAHRLRIEGPNVVASERRFTLLRLLLRALVNPLVLLLLVLALVSFLTGDAAAGTIMLVMVGLGVLLRFFQEARADAAAARLRAMIRVTATVVRDGKPLELPLEDLVRGDVVQLSAGDMIPADLRLVAVKDLHVVQASLTGESFPAEKTDAPSPVPSGARETGAHSPLELHNICFLGTSVETGSAHGVVVAAGRWTFLGGVAAALAEPPPESSFDRGVRRFTWLMIWFIVVMAPLVFLINGLSKHDWKEAFFFAVAVAVGLTPEMLPMIVTVCLSKGAMLMSRRRVIVKRLNAIQNLGAMDVLCTDKTGTLTMDRILLEKHCDVVLREDEDVLALAYLNSHFQTGLKNVMDRAILEYRHLHEQLNIPEHEKVDEIPFDFTRKVMSVVVRLPNGGHRLICKGAPRRCSGAAPASSWTGNSIPWNTSSSRTCARSTTT